MDPLFATDPKTESTSEPLFERLFEFSPDGILVADGQERIVRANGPAERMFGYGRGELVDQPIEIVVPERFRSAHAFYRRDYIEKLRSKPGIICVESFARRRDATEFPAEIILTPVVDGESGPLVLAVVRDITQRKHAEDALRRSESHYRTLLENLPQKIYLKDRNSVFISCNENLARDLKIDLREFSGKTDFDLFPKEQAEKYRAGDRMIVEGGGTSEIDEEYFHDGEKRVVHTVKTAVKDETGATTGVLGIFWDITEHKRADEALGLREQQLQSILDNSPATIYLKDPQGRYLKINRHCAEALGATEEQIIGKLTRDFLPREMADAIRANEQEVIECGCPKQFEEVVAQKDGLHTYVATKFPLLDSAGKPYAVCGISTDITDRKKAEEALAENERFTRASFDALSSHIAVLDGDGRILATNRAWRLFGEKNGLFPEQACEGANYLSVCGSAGEEGETAARVIRSVIAGQSMEGVFEYPCHSPQEKRWFLCHITRFLGEGPVRVVVAHENITERKNAEEALRQSEERFRQIAENIHDVFWIASSDFHEILYVSPAYEEVWGRTCQSLYERPLDWVEGIHPDDRELVNRIFLKALERCKGFDLGYRVVRPDGSIRYVRDRAFPVLDATGKTYRFVGIATDFTERQQSREELRKREEQLQSILDHSNAVISLKDREGRYLKVNREVARLAGKSEEELIGKSTYEVLPKEAAAECQAHDEEVFASRSAKQFEEIIPQRDGPHTYLSVKVPLLDSAGTPYALCGISTDITERKRMEEALREREQQLQSILDNSTSAIYLKDSEGRYLRVNRRFEEMFETSRENLVGRTAYDVVPKDKGDRLRAMDLKVLESGLPTEFEEVIPTNDGLRTYISTKFPIVDSSGHPWAVGGIMTDITDRKRTESALLLEMTNVLISNLEPQKLLAAVSAGLRRVVEHEYSTLALYDSETNQLRAQRLTSPRPGEPLVEEILLPIEGSPAGYVFSTREPMVLDRMDVSRFPEGPLRRAELLQRWIDLGVKSACWLPLLHRGNALGVLLVASEREGAFPEKAVGLLTQVADQIAVALDNALAFRQIADSMDRLAQEKLYLEDELKTEYNFEEIVGSSASLKRVLKTVETVAPTEATVLILGETGTGKELIARAIHNLSPRRGRTLVKLNCAAIPAGLLESEIFGHEKGAFTGAIARKIGRLEVATGGTLLLDEIGDIPLELQPKLLRALQEKEFERVGSTRTIPADVRIIAATNRDLAQMVKDGRFRRDLFYRLSVIPITIPPLRERKDDIPLLVHYFLQKHSQRMDRHIKTIPPEVMQTLVNWRWPGNVREMENLIERAVILSTGPELRVPLAELRVEPDGREGAISSPAGGTLETVEREHILQILRETKGVIGGPLGAAVRLGLKRTTLNFKLRKLGITREDF